MSVSVEPCVAPDLPADDRVVLAAEGLSHSYGDRRALNGVSLSVSSGEVVAMLGPNGSGKTTLFRLLSTIVPVTSGRLKIDGVDAAADPLGVRQRIGIVFQSPSLDGKLTVDENLACQAALYGLRGDAMRGRRDECLAAMKLTDRRGDFCETLSGGLKRRVELAKGLLHRPRLLLLDEPSTGLDPAARIDLADAVRRLAGDGTAVLMTTHLIEEADLADRVVILSEGEKIAEGRPDDLRGELGGDVITVRGDATKLRRRLHEMGIEAAEVRGTLRITSDRSGGLGAKSLVGRLIETLGDDARSIEIGRPSLRDVFIARTGHDFRDREGDS